MTTPLPDTGVLIVGATGPTGMLVTQALRAAGCPVTAILRSPERRPELEALGVKVVSGDAMNRTGIFQSIESTQDSLYILLNLLGGNPFMDPATWPDQAGVDNVTDAAVAAGFRRYVLVTSVGTGASLPYVPESASYIRPIIELKSQAEAHLKASGLDWTILKPGGLGPPDYKIKRGQPLITENHGVRGLIDRDDLAATILKVLAAPASRVRHRELYAVVDRIEHHAGIPTAFEL